MAQYDTPETDEELPGFATDEESGFTEEMDKEEFEGYVSRMLEDSIQYCDELSTDRVLLPNIIPGTFQSRMMKEDLVQYPMIPGTQ